MRSLILALSAGLASWGAEPTRIAVMPVDLGSEGEPALADALRAVLVEAISDDEMMAVTVEQACSDAACLAGIARDADTTHVIVARVEGDVNDYRVELVAHDAKGVARHSLKFDCEICTHGDLEAKLTREAAALRKKLDTASSRDLEERPATLAVTTAQGAARVFVDGKEVGTTPYEGEIAPGQHTLTVEADGYASEEVPFEARSGAQSSFALVLQPASEARTAKPRHLRIAGYTSLGIGLGTLVAGSVLLGIDSRPVRSRCSGDSIDINGTCEFLHDTRVVGAVLTSVGVAALVTGVALAITGRSGRESKARAAATIGGVRF